MCEIKRINILKKRSSQIVEKLSAKNPLSVLPINYVSSTGLTYSDISDKIAKISKCASIIELKESFIEKDHSFEQVMKVAAANFCKQHAICPICADRMQSRRRAKYKDPIKAQAARVSAGERHAYIVTYTIADGESLGERLEHLKESKKNFRKMGQCRQDGTRSRGEAAKIKAALSTFEIKRGTRSGLWHVHCHDLVFTNKPLDYSVYDQELKRELSFRYGRSIPKEVLASTARQQVKFQGNTVAVSKLSEEWFRATGGDSIDISVDKVQHVPKNASGKKKRMFLKMSFEESVSYQAKEVLKYITKPSETNISDSLIVLNETYNKRMVATYGEFRGIKGDDYNDERSPEDENFVMTWKDGKYGDAVPGKYRDNASEDVEESKTRSKVGIELGEYRRKRRMLIEQRNEIGPQLSSLLDTLKETFKSRVSVIWRSYRNSVNASKMIKNANCDKYSPILALAGAYYPGSCSSDIYANAFR